MTFAPLQSDQLEEFKGAERRKAGRNFSTINDYFLVSFLGFSSAATCMYLSELTTVESYLALLTSVLDLSVFAGITGLIWAIMYVRLIVKTEKTWYSVNPPDFLYTYAFFAATFGVVYLTAQNLIGSRFPIVQFVWFCAIIVVAWGGGWKAIRYHDEWQLGNRDKRQGIVGCLMLILTPIVAYDIIIALLRFG